MCGLTETFAPSFLLWFGARQTFFSDTVYLGAAPVGFLGHADILHGKGIVGVINMCGEYRGPLEEYSRLGIEQLWLPTVVR